MSHNTSLPRQPASEGADAGQGDAHHEHHLETRRLSVDQSLPDLQECRGADCLSARGEVPTAPAVCDRASGDEYWSDRSPLRAFSKAVMRCLVGARPVWVNSWHRTLEVECLLWMAPALQEVIRCSGALVGCSLLSGLLCSHWRAAGPDGVGERDPNLLIRL